VGQMNDAPGLLHFGALSREARKGIEVLYARREWEDIEDRTWLTREACALMFFHLRAAPDDPDVFPKGKWATIQALESLLDRAVGHPE
jgi:hypothetical protein